MKDLRDLADPHLPRLRAPAYEPQVNLKRYRGTSLMRKCPPPLGPPWGPRHRSTVGFFGGAVSYQRGTPVCRESLLDEEEHLSNVSELSHECQDQNLALTV